jgi:hypothetical protein
VYEALTWIIRVGFRKHLGDPSAAIFVSILEEVLFRGALLVCGKLSWTVLCSSAAAYCRRHFLQKANHRDGYLEFGVTDASANGKGLPKYQSDDAHFR